MPVENSAVRIVRSYPNLIVVRSLSKAFGLPGLRVGYAIASGGLREGLFSIVPPYILSTPGVFYALEVLAGSTEILERSKHAIAQIKEELLSFLSGYVIPETSRETPIFVLGWPDPEIDLFYELM